MNYINVILMNIIIFIYKAIITIFNIFILLFGIVYMIFCELYNKAIFPILAFLMVMIIGGIFMKEDLSFFIDVIILIVSSLVIYAFTIGEGQWTIDLREYTSKKRREVKYHHFHQKGETIINNNEVMNI